MGPMSGGQKNTKAALGQHKRSGTRMGTQSEEDIMTGCAGHCEIGIDLGFHGSLPWWGMSRTPSSAVLGFGWFETSAWPVELL